MNLFAPFSVGINSNKIDIKKNKVSAANEIVYSFFVVNNKKIPTGLAITFPTMALCEQSRNQRILTEEQSGSGNIIVNCKENTLSGIEALNAALEMASTKAESIKVIINSETTAKIIKVYVYVAWQTNTILSKELVEVSLYDLNGTLIEKKEVEMVDSFGDNNNQNGVVSFNTNISPETEYKISTIAAQGVYKIGSIPPQFETSVSGKPDPDPLIIKTQPIGVTTFTSTGTQKQGNFSPQRSMPACSILPNWAGGQNGTFSGCIAQAFYYVLFVPTSYLFALAGTFFDYTFSYSVQDSSYRSTFVVEGWGLVRDFCNLFFIFIMLYIAISTILNVHGFNTKSTIINVVIIGLFINFSLFATQIIIDASNITARVFYNANTIKITEKGANGVAEATPGLVIREGGIIPLSEALVNKINPQNMIINSGNINNIPNSSESSIVDNNKTDNMNAGTFILIVILASAINIVGFTVFITIGLLFVARVIGLWLAMILAPLAFFTYIIPDMASIKMIGWKNWWSDIIKLAFLAPVFMFFLYIILKFLQTDLISDPMSKTVSADGLGFFVATIIPFAFIMILMMKAKKIAVDMSGEMGATVSKIGGVASGMILGAGVGLGAMAMRGTIGKAGAALADSKFVRNNGFLGRALGDAGKWTASKSFDVRNTKAGTAATSSLSVDAGKAKTGGFTQARIDQKVKTEKRAKELELSENSPEKTKVRKAQVALKELENLKSHDINTIEGKLTAARQKVIDANAAVAAISDSEEDKGKKAAARATAQAANDEVTTYNAEKGNITNGGPIKDNNGRIIGYHTTNGNITKKGLDDAEKAEKEAALILEEIEAKAMTAQSDAAEILERETVAINGILKTEMDAIQKIEDAARASSGGIIKDTTISDNIKALRKTAADKAANATTVANIKATESVRVANTEHAIAETKAIETSNIATAARNSADRVNGGIGKSINDIKFTDIPNAEHEVHHLENDYKSAYAKSQRGGVSKDWNYVTSAGQYDFDAAEVAADNIITGTVTPKGSSSGGGDHGSSGGGHSSTPAATHKPVTSNTSHGSTSGDGHH